MVYYLLLSMFGTKIQAKCPYNRVKCGLKTFSLISLLPQKSKQHPLSLYHYLLYLNDTECLPNIFISDNIEDI